MRLRHLGLFAHVLHIRPWEIGLLTVPDFLRLCAWVDAYNAKPEES